MRSQGRSECNGRWCTAEGQPLLAAAVTVALLSLPTAATAAAAAANLILRTHRLTEKGVQKGGREGEEKRMLLSGAERKRVMRGREAGAALTTSREAARNIALSREGWVTLCKRSIPLCPWSGYVLMISTRVSRSITCDLRLTLDFWTISPQAQRISCNLWMENQKTRISLQLLKCMKGKD